MKTITIHPSNMTSVDVKITNELYQQIVTAWNIAKNADFDFTIVFFGLVDDANLEFRVGRNFVNMKGIDISLESFVSLGSLM